MYQLKIDDAFLIIIICLLIILWLMFTKNNFTSLSLLNLIIKEKYLISITKTNIFTNSGKINFSYYHMNWHKTHFLIYLNILILNDYITHFHF